MRHQIVVGLGLTRCRSVPALLRCSLGQPTGPCAGCGGLSSRLLTYLLTEWARDTKSVVAPEVTQAANDKKQLAPMIGKLEALPKQLGRTRRILVDSGYASERNVGGCAAAGIEPLIALKRERHHKTWRQRFAAAPTPPPQSATAMEKMRYCRSR